MKSFGLILLLFLTSNIYSKTINEHVLQAKQDKVIKLIAPPLQQRKGAIRGVSINFRMLSGTQRLNYELINPPKGMRVTYSHYIATHISDGLYVRWDVPMNIEEKIYNITVQSTDLEGNKRQIQFPIKVPKTSVIQTEIINNELIVTDQKSPLYGMKMKGHNGEDISNLKLRSVNYLDVWKKKSQKLDLTKEIKYTVFIIDNMPEKLDIKFPKYMDTFEKRIKLGAGFDRYDESGFGIISSSFWKWRHGSSYLYEDTNGVTLPHKYYEKERNGSKVLIFTINEKL